MSTTEIEYFTSSRIEYDLELSNYDEVEENLIDLVFEERMKFLYTLERLEHIFKNEKMFTQLYVTMQHDYYYKKMPYIFSEIIHDIIKLSKNNNNLRSLIEIILNEFCIDIEYNVDV